MGMTMTKSMAMTMMLSEAVGIEDDGNINDEVRGGGRPRRGGRRLIPYDISLLHSSTLIISCLGVLFHVAE